jgi:hypothetical protein
MPPNLAQSHRKLAQLFLRNLTPEGALPFSRPVRKGGAFNSSPGGGPSDALQGGWPSSPAASITRACCSLSVGREENGVPHFSRFSKSGSPEGRHRSGLEFYAAGGRIFILSNLADEITESAPCGRVDLVALSDQVRSGVQPVRTV